MTLTPALDGRHDGRSAMSAGIGEEGHPAVDVLIDLTKVYDSVDRSLLWTVLKC